MNFRNVITYERYGLAAAALAICGSFGAFAQTAPAFAPGNIVVSRTTYTGTTSTVPFPGILPNNAASVADGSFPNVFNNETPDGSFGVTSPIFMDRMTRTGGLISTFPLTQEIFNQTGMNVTTSFPSKSEIGLHVTPDGTGIMFMAYGAPANALDVSNANTPGHVDITNPVNGRGILINQRDVVQLNANGNVQVTKTNTYSGNNGRNVVLGSNGNYYMVGNAGNNGKSVSLKSGTVTVTSGSANVSLSGSSTTANLYVGTPFSGANIPAGAYITSITDSTHFTISAAATGVASGAYTANAGAVQLVGISFSSGDTTVVVADTSKLAPGMPLSGTGFPAGSYIQSVADATHFVASSTPTSNSDAGSYTAAVSNSMLSDDTGVQMIPQGMNDTAGTGTGIVDSVTNSKVVGVVNGTYGTATGYQRGFTITQIGAAADKTGKDDNFRGLTNHNNTIYVSKGSGGNGFDGVYQVNPSGGGYVAPGTSAGLATSATAATASINPLPGWPTTSTGANESSSATTPIVYHPFGLWFANDTTLYVGDEGAPGVTNAATGGLQKWIYNTGTSQWQLAYTVEAGTIPGYTVTGIGTLQAGGLRNITGINNGDGTVTLYGITSTIGQTLNDEGADPNQLVAFTDTVTARTLPANSFTVIETAAYGDALRGVEYIPGVVVTSSGFVRDRRTGLYSQQITIQNATSSALSGPVDLALDNLSANATLSNKTGTIANNPPIGSPYITIPGTSGGLAAGASATVTLQFTNPNNGAITYSARTLTGATP